MVSVIAFINPLTINMKGNIMNTLFNKTKEVTLEEFISMWDKGGSVSFSQYSNGDKRNYLFVSKDIHGNESYYTLAVNNVRQYEDAGWVTSGIKASGYSEEQREVAQLPEDWEEVSITYADYPTFFTKVVARNNMDGTVQLFRA